MSKFFIHQRIKKVRGEVCLGLEGTLCALWHEDPFYDAKVVLDHSHTFTEPETGNTYWLPGGQPIGIQKEQWEPAIGPEPSIEEAPRRIEETV